MTPSPVGEGSSPPCHSARREEKCLLAGAFQRSGARARSANQRSEESRGKGQNANAGRSLTYVRDDGLGSGGMTGWSAGGMTGWGRRIRSRHGTSPRWGSYCPLCYNPPFVPPLHKGGMATPSSFRNEAKPIEESPRFRVTLRGDPSHTFGMTCWGGRDDELGHRDGGMTGWSESAEKGRTPVRPFS